jgi:hypothetical protein
VVKVVKIAPSTARPLGSPEKLEIAHQVALTLSDLHDAEAIRDETGRITSAAKSMQISNQINAFTLMVGVS